MPDLQTELANWRRMVYGSPDPPKMPDPPLDTLEGQLNYVSDMLVERYKPRWSWFRPPFWWIFRWAFKIDKTVFHGVYPSGCNYSTDNKED